MATCGEVTLTIRVEGRPDVEAFRCRLAAADVRVNLCGRALSPMPVRGEVSGVLTFDPGFNLAGLLTWLVELERYRELGRILTLSRVRPGAVFSGLMDARRN